MEWKKEIFKEIDHVLKNEKSIWFYWNHFFSFEYVFSNLKKDKTKEIFEEIDWKKKYLSSYCFFIFHEMLRILEY